MLQRILVPLDGSPRAEQAIPVAASIAKNTGGTVLLSWRRRWLSPGQGV
ncbi:MAG: universal stress protein [Ktedonobacteraceae bacterium]